jgi:DNA modification methylase
MPESVKGRPSRRRGFVVRLKRSERHLQGRLAARERAGGGGPRGRRPVWQVNASPLTEAHFAAFPAELILPCILAPAVPGGHVPDPFFGSGTAGLVCLGEDRRLIGIKPSPD